MSRYVDFNAIFFRGVFSANECSFDISNMFEWLRTSDLKEIYVCRCLGKFSLNRDQVLILILFLKFLNVFYIYNSI